MGSDLQGLMYRVVAAGLIVLIGAGICSGEEKEKTLQVLEAKSSLIIDAAKDFHVPPRLLLSAIYADRRMHYNLLDTYMDVAIAKTGRDNSIGVAQVRVSTALWVSQTMQDEESPYFLGNRYRSYIPFITDRDSVINVLSEPKWNVYFAAAYSAMILKRWSDGGFDISKRVEIFATLYNLGPYRRDGTEREPHPNPQENEYGYVAKDFYDSTALIDTFPMN